MVAANRTPADYQRHLEHVGKLPLVPRVATTEDVANAVRFVACTESGFVTGEILHVAGGYHLAPSGWS
jgi:enoyl-[acyl-carrier-protein] reductase (NADH)